MCCGFIISTWTPDSFCPALGSIIMVCFGQQISKRGIEDAIRRETSGDLKATLQTISKCCCYHGYITNTAVESSVMQ